MDSSFLFEGSALELPPHTPGTSFGRSLYGCGAPFPSARTTRQHWRAHGPRAVSDPPAKREERARGGVRGGAPSVGEAQERMVAAGDRRQATLTRHFKASRRARSIP